MHFVLSWSHVYVSVSVTLAHGIRISSFFALRFTDFNLCLQIKRKHRLMSYHSRAKKIPPANFGTNHQAFSPSFTLELIQPLTWPKLTTQVIRDDRLKQDMYFVSCSDLSLIIPLSLIITKIDCFFSFASKWTQSQSTIPNAKTQQTSNVSGWFPVTVSWLMAFGNQSNMKAEHEPSFKKEPTASMFLPGQGRKPVLSPNPSLVSWGSCL